ncbi:MAG: hypothetical protein ACR2LV_10870 [Solirubrobacteraceae bacterium]
MAEESQTWEYGCTAWTTTQDAATQITAHMKQWSEAGWELFSAQSSPYVLVSGGGGAGAAGFVAVNQMRSRCWVHHTMIWRKRVFSAPLEPTPRAA